MKHSLSFVTGSFVALAAGCRGKHKPSWFELSEWEVRVPSLGEAFDGFKILQLTDIHFSEWMDTRRLAELKEFTLSQPVDLIAVTGDSTYHTTDFQPLIDFYTGLDANAAVLMTWGNHDIWDEAEKGLAPVLGANVHLLKNERYLLQRGDDHLCVAGLDCAYEELDDIAKVVDDFPAETPALIMAHEPDIAPSIAETRKFFLQISGHSHGGQICLPTGHAPILPWLGQKYSRGYYEVDGMMLYTSRGLGRGKPFIRMNCPAEVVIYTLRSGKNTRFEEIKT